MRFASEAEKKKHVKQFHAEEGSKELLARLADQARYRWSPKKNLASWPFDKIAMRLDLISDLGFWRSHDLPGGSNVAFATSKTRIAFVWIITLIIIFLIC